MSRFSYTNPESLRGRLFLLVFDKLFLGAILGAAFVGYAWWTRTETRRYEERIRDGDLAFRRAQYLKELVPLVTNNKQDPLVRAELLTALIDTRSVDDQSAFVLAERVLKAGALRADYPKDMMWEGDHFLMDSLLKRMPSALESLLRHYTVNSIYVAVPSEFNGPSLQDLRNRHDTAEFWKVLFRRTVETYPDKDLTLLGDQQFLDQYLYALYQLSEVRGRHGGPLAAVAWRERGPKGLRILAALAILREGPDDEDSAAKYRSEQRDDAVKYLSELVDPRKPGREDLQLSATLLRLLAENTTQDRLGAPGLIQHCANIVLTSTGSPNQDETRFLAWSRANAARDYLTRSAAAGWSKTVSRTQALGPAK